MIDLLINQAESDSAFRRWVSAMLKHGKFQGTGWSLDRGGLFFTNYGQSTRGTIGEQVMLGHDTETRDGTVKIVRPNVATNGRGKLTTIGQDENGNHILLREGWLKPNHVSSEVKIAFESLSGLTPLDVRLGGRPSSRQWYMVANLSHSKRLIVDETNDFTLACIRARSLTGGGRTVDEMHETKTITYGMDEKHRVILVNRKGGKQEIQWLQGAVFEELRKCLGGDLAKPKANGYEVDGLLEAANLLVEIKTGTHAKNCYEGVGQLRLYPSLIGLKPDLIPALLLPDKPPLRPVMARALHEANIDVYTYNVGDVGKKPNIKFSAAFLAACKRRSS